MAKKEEDNKNQKKDRPHRRWIALSGAGIQMGVVVFASAYVGDKLDTNYKTETPWFTLGFVLMGIFISLYLLIKQINNLEN